MFEGEMLIIQPKKGDQTDKERIFLKDYSLRKRLPTKKHGEDHKTKKKDNSKTKLQCLEVNIEDPVCLSEWQNVSEVLNHKQGLVWL
jgi:hypothetical protein